LGILLVPINVNSKTLGKHIDSAENKNILLTKEVDDPIIKKKACKKPTKELLKLSTKGKNKSNPDQKRR